MALTRSEIEIIIKARNEAQGAFDSLNKQIKQVTGESTKASTAMTSQGAATKQAGVAATATGVAFGLLAERVGRGLLNAFQDTLAAANRLDAGLIGLSSVATAFGQDAQKAQIAAQRLAQDGLMSVGEAATSLKNLLAAGFGLDQAVLLVNRFKDSAAFGRQAALGFGQAISSATEGIKNGNSILVDNAGVTKNLSNMLVEAGFSATDLSKASTDVGVRMAIFNGILKETTPQLGDAGRLLQTAAGQQAVFNSQVEIAQAKIGKALQPAVAGLLSVMVPLAKAIGDNANVLVPLAAAVAAIVVPMAAMNAAAALGITKFVAMGAGAIQLGGSLMLSVRSFEQARIAINLMGDAAGITVAKMGLLGSAGAVAGAAFVGWQIGKVINELTGADKIVEDLALAVMGLVKTNPGVNEAEMGMRKYLHTLKTAGAIKPPAPPDTDPIVQGFLKIANAGQESQKRIAAWKDELGRVANAGGLPTLRKELDLGVLSVKELSTEFGISEDAIKFYEKNLKDAAEQQKDSQAAAKKHQEAVKSLADEMLKAGIISKEGLALKLTDLNKVINMAATGSVAGLKASLEELGPEFDKLITAARNSGMNVDSLAMNLEGLRKMAGIGIRDAIIPMTKSLDDLSAAGQVVEEKMPAAIQKVIDAYHQFGLQTPEDLKRVSAETAKHYQVLVAQGTATKEQLKAAWQQMIDAQKKASGQLPSVWQTEVVPGIKDALGHMNTAVQGSFAQMMIGAKGFKDGFSDIWNSLKSTALNVMNEILSTFMNQFVKGMLGYLTGQKGAFSTAFGGMFGGGGGAGGGAGSSITQAAIKKGASYLGIGGGGAVATGGGAAGAGAGVAGAGAAGAGASGAGGTAAGVGTGIGVGTTLAVTGGVAAAALLAWGIWKKGLFRGGEESLKVNKPREQFFERHGGSVESLGEKLGLAGFNGEEARLMIERVFQSDTVKEFEAAVDAVELGLIHGAEAMKAGTVAADGMAAAQENAALVFQTSSAAQTESMKAVLQTLIDQGELIDANGQKITDMGQVAFVEAAEASADATEDMEQQINVLRKHVMDFTGSGGIVGQFDRGFDQSALQAKASLAEIQRALNQLKAPKLHVDVDYDRPDNSPPPAPEPEAYGASGIMARRPGIIEFGEGGEDEVGGPASFFEKVFKRLGIEGNGGGGGTTFNFNVTTTSADGLREAVEKEIIPMMIDALKANRRQARTNMRQVMGVR